ncbi:MAG TPA: 50S ribosomal protein L11 methyltransferase [Parachlamydiaceae bacterium]|nr:50S ribosomal protein L11 methyltransferase [Parachlamydiaceae bacterium]
MKCVSVQLHPKANIEEASKELELLGGEVLYSEEENSHITIYLKIEQDFDLKVKSPHIKSILPYKLPEINWEEQYENHGLNYFDGLVHADLKDFGCLNPLYNPIKIQPGPGFGDLSHPTTTLTIKLMNGHLSNSQVLDIGSGSGILSFAAISMGATSVFGIDIDEDAISHSKLNSRLNQMEEEASFGLPQEFTAPQNQKLTILMNMIQKEQKEAWESLKSIHKIPGECFTSGILKSGKKEYLKWTKSLGWKLLSTLESDGWLAFHFTR